LGFDLLVLLAASFASLEEVASSVVIKDSVAFRKRPN
jgi:hypothetical protein